MSAAICCIWHRAEPARKFFFDVTLDRADIVRHLPVAREPRKAPIVLSPEEVARMLEAAPGLKYKAALSVALWGGSAGVGSRCAQGKGRQHHPIQAGNCAPSGAKAGATLALTPNPVSKARRICFCLETGRFSKKNREAIKHEPDNRREGSGA